MSRTLRRRDARGLVWILVGCAVAWQLWRWVPMVPELVPWWDAEPGEPTGQDAVNGWDPRVLFTPQALLPLVFYAFGLVVTLVLVRRFQHRPGFRWATAGSLQVLALLAGFATSGWQMMLGLVNVTDSNWFGDPNQFGPDWVTAPLLSCLLTGGGSPPPGEGAGGGSPTCRSGRWCWCLRGWWSRPCSARCPSLAA